jgi:hypothetical protein
MDSSGSLQPFIILCVWELDWLVVRFIHIRKFTLKISRECADKGKKSDITENLSKDAQEEYL